MRMNGSQLNVRFCACAACVRVCERENLSGMKLQILVQLNEAAAGELKIELKFILNLQFDAFCIN